MALRRGPDETTTAQPSPLRRPSGVLCERLIFPEVLDQSSSPLGYPPSRRTQKRSSKWRHRDPYLPKSKAHARLSPQLQSIPRCRLNRGWPRGALVLQHSSLANCKPTQPGFHLGSPHYRVALPICWRAGCRLDPQKVLARFWQKIPDPGHRYLDRIIPISIPNRIVRCAASASAGASRDSRLVRPRPPPTIRGQS